MIQWSDQVWDEVDRAVEAWHAAQAENRRVEIGRHLPGPNADSRLPVLLTLVKIELEASWVRGDARTVEHFVRQWPELADDPDALSELIESECRARLQANAETPDVGQLKQRFPDWDGRLDVQSMLRESSLDHSPIDSQAASLLQTVSAYRAAGPTGKATMLPIGGKLGRYSVLSVLGRGSMGAVYLAKDSLLDRAVAIKVLHPWVAEDATLEKLADEARAAARLKHTSIVPVYDMDVSDEGIPFLVMAFIEGESLADELARGRMSVQRATELTRQLAAALHAAHQAGFTHRDIKPANVLIDEWGNAHITDFGLALHRQETDEDSALVGTPAYMSPEQLRKGPVDHRADIWALGVVLFEMLSGERPFQGDSVATVCRNVEQTAPDPSVLKSMGVPRTVERACLRCLEKDPEQRFKTAGEIEAALAAPTVNRKYVIMGVAASLFVAIAAGPFVLDWGRRTPSRDLTLSPWIADCKTGVAINTGATIDLELAGQAFRSSPGILFSKRVLEIDSSRRREFKVEWQAGWLCFEAPLTLPDLSAKQERSALCVPREFDLKLRVAMNSRGQIQLGTKGPAPEDHLAMLAMTMAGVSNYTDFGGAIMPPERYQRQPRDFVTENDEWQSLFALWGRLILVELQRQEVVTGGPANDYELSACPVRHFNHFDSEITVVAAWLHHQQFDYDWYKPEQRLIDERANLLWSPIANETRQTAELESRFTVRAAADHPSVLFVRATTDGQEEGAAEHEFNSSRVRVEGKWERPHDYWRKDGTQAKVNIDQDAAKQKVVLTAENIEVSMAEALLYDVAPREIHLQARSTYSVVRSSVRFATLGAVEVDPAEYSPKQRDGRAIRPLVWRIPANPTPDQ